jgi:methylmalonyl-CoA mutase cobalamin-binding domain/chain
MIERNIFLNLNLNIIIDMTSNITKNIIELENDKVLNEVKNRLNQGEDPMKLIDECNQGLIMVGEKYKNKEFFLAELILSGEIFKKAMEIIEPYLTKKSTAKIKGKVLLATIQGDIHDLGKNILNMLLKINGFKVYDLGVDVDPMKVFEKVREIHPDFIGFSTLLTVTFDPMKKIIDLLKKEGLRNQVKIMIGGGITTTLLKEYIGADFQSIDAMEGVDYCLKIMKERGVK